MRLREKELYPRGMWERHLGPVGKDFRSYMRPRKGGASVDFQRLLVFRRLVSKVRFGEMYPGPGDRLSPHCGEELCALTYRGSDASDAWSASCQCECHFCSQLRLAD